VPTLTASVPKAQDLARLSVADRLEVMDELWASLRSEADSLHVPGWHNAEIERRLAAMAADGNCGRPADEVRADLKRKL